MTSKVVLGSSGVDRSRRQFLQTAGAGLGMGLGALALSACAGGSDGKAADAPDRALAAGQPSTSTSLEPSEYLWTGARSLFVTVPIASVSGAPWLPPGLTLTEPATATFFVARYPLTAFRSVYNEAAVFLHVTDADGPARHCAWMVVDDDTALIYGRELLGFPKKMAEIELREDDDGRVVGTVSRHGEEILRLEADVGGFAEEAGPVWGADRIVNAHGSVIGGMRQLILPPLPEEVLSRSAGRVSITVGTTDRDPLGDLSPESDGDGLWAVTNFGKLESVPTLGPEIPFDWAYSMSLFSPRVQ